MPIVKLEPTAVLLNVNGICGHLLIVGRVRQTRPVNCACPGRVDIGRMMSDPRRRIVTATCRFIQVITEVFDRTSLWAYRRGRM